MTVLLSGDTDVTISLALPLLLELKKDVDSADIPSGLKSSLSIQFDRRFRHMYDPKYQNFDSLYAAATYLDPRYGEKGLGDTPEDLLSRKVTVQQFFMKALLCKSSESSDRRAERIISSVDSEPSPKRQRVSLLDRISARCDIASSSSSNPSKGPDTRLCILAEMALYEGPSLVNLRDAPLKFWQTYKKQLPLLHDVALSILVMRVSSTPSERLFSLAGQINSLLRTCLAPFTLSKLAFAKANF